MRITHFCYNNKFVTDHSIASQIISRRKNSGCYCIHLLNPRELFVICHSKSEISIPTWSSSTVKVTLAWPVSFHGPMKRLTSKRCTTKRYSDTSRLNKWNFANEDCTQIYVTLTLPMLSQSALQCLEQGFWRVWTEFAILKHLSSTNSIYNSASIDGWHWNSNIQKLMKLWLTATNWETLWKTCVQLIPMNVFFHLKFMTFSGPTRHKSWTFKSFHSEIISLSVASCLSKTTSI